MNESSQDTNVEHNESDLVSFRLSPQLKTQFIAHVRQAGTSFSLTGFLKQPDVVAAERAYEAECKKRGIMTPEMPPAEVVDAFSKMYTKITSSEGAGKNPQVLVRWLKADNEQHLRRIVDGLGQNGGKVGELIGVCMSEPGSKADDTIRMQMSNGDDLGVLLLYDANKLGELTQEERRSDTSFYAGYGYKPKQGETFRSALLGTMVI